MSTPCSTRRSTRASTRLQPARARADVHRPGDRRRGHGRGEPPEVEGIRLQRGRATPTPATDRATATSPAPRPPRRSPTGWPATRPVQGAGSELIIGDLNSYDKEDPIDALRDAGYTDLELRSRASTRTRTCSTASSATSTTPSPAPSSLDNVTGAGAWHINSDEPSLIDYDMTFKKPAQDALFAPDEWRSSDHDPVVIGLDLTPPDTTAPELTPHGVARAWSSRRTTSGARSRSTSRRPTTGGEVTVELVDTQADGPQGRHPGRLRHRVPGGRPRRAPCTRSRTRRQTRAATPRPSRSRCASVR